MSSKYPRHSYPVEVKDADSQIETGNDARAPVPSHSTHRLSDNPTSRLCLHANACTYRNVFSDMLKNLFIRYSAYICTIIEKAPLYLDSFSEPCFNGLV